MNNNGNPVEVVDSKTGRKARGSVAGGVISLIVAILSLAYIIWPLDFIPDLVIGVGWLDDLAALVPMITSTVLAIKNFRSTKRAGNQPQ